MHLKSLPQYQWLNTISANVPKQAIRDAYNDFANFRFHGAPQPHFKKRSLTHPSFYQDGNKIYVSDTHVKLEKIGCKEDGTFHENLIPLVEHGRLPRDAKYENPRISFDGLHWWISISIYMPDNPPQPYYPKSDGIGIDLGLYNYATLSDGTVFPNINKSDEVLRLEKKSRRLHLSLQRKYRDANLPTYYYHFDRYSLSNFSPPSTHKNIIKTERQLLTLEHHLYNIRINHINKIVSSIVKRKPKYIVIEDLIIRKIVQDPKLRRSIKNQYFLYFREHLQKKCSEIGIPLIIADRFFPSTQLCCKCGKLKKIANLSTRIYECSCGNRMDRDIQAAINLQNYGRQKN